MADDLLVVGRQAERVQVGAEGAHEVLDLVLDQVGGVARDRQLLGQLLGQREQLALDLDRLLPAARHAREAQDLVLRRVVAGSSAKLRRISSSAADGSPMRFSRTSARSRRSSTRSAVSVRARATCA